MHTPLVIIGSGPAGLSSAIYTCRSGIDTIVFGSKPKVAGDYEIDNYFGFEETISGKELLGKGRAQAERFGARFKEDRVLSVHHNESGGFHIKTEHEEFDACAVILATGVGRVRPGISNLKDYEGKGVSYCVSCDGFFYKNRKVIVVGEGIYAANQALELLSYTPHVTIITQGKKSSITPEFQQRLSAAGITVSEQKIETLSGSPALSSVTLSDGTSLEAEGIFIAMGEASSLDFAYTLGLERSGVFLVADKEQKTNIPGIYAAGDCTGGFLQIAVAVGEGATAARSAIAHIKENCKG
ncbi:NAD(P)/FAD-dependent oxidoreductase [Oleidesulfovibrio alaskensis]|uniref:NAD(P)/FAD-dependent oxidoreductase n=1 Tax=Oleidesulfovibrio alaskensis TaxID=58180 RepID=UPI00040063F6|nr:NAD(P)/FAD-dependent oxidoreductase [Oleidesulfovibrio alaskensis]